MWKAYLFLYLLQLGDLRFTIVVILAIAAIILGMIWAALIMNDPDVIFDKEQVSEGYVKGSENLKNTIIKRFVALCILSLFPSKETLTMMGGLYLGNQAVQAVSGTEVVKKVAEIVNLKLDKIIVDMKEEVKKGTK